MTIAEDFADDMTAAASALDDLTSPHEAAPKTEKPPAKDYPCPHCDKVYTNGPDFLRRVNLDNHIKHRHTDRPPVIPKAGRNAGLKHPRAKAAVKAVGPGTASIVNFPTAISSAKRSRMVATRSAPGSEMPGVPASETRAILAPGVSASKMASISATEL